MASADNLNAFWWCGLVLEKTTIELSGQNDIDKSLEEVSGVF